jgi:SEC-C motif-containing protein
MRSRFAAFALGRWGYLWDTLHPDHEDRDRDREAFARDLERSQKAVRYLRLSILDASAPDADGAATVRFFAEVRASGRDRSFVERSTFVHDGHGWRYLCGTIEPAPA